MTCKDCIHSKVCEFFSYRITSNAEQKCKHFKDLSRFVELPCKLGDFVYFIKVRRGLQGNRKKE